MLLVEKSRCGWALLEALVELHPLWEEDGPLARARLLSEVAPLVQVVAMSRQCDSDPALLATMPKLGLVACLGEVEDGDALRALRDRGVRVTGTKCPATCERADFAARTALELLDLTASERSGIMFEKGPVSKTSL